MVGSIFSKRMKKKLLGFLIVILLFLSIFHFMSIFNVFHSTRGNEVLTLSVNPPNRIESVRNFITQSTDGINQIKNIIKLETVLKFKLFFFGKIGINNFQDENHKRENSANRSIIERVIEQNPGITLRKIQRVTGLALGVIQYHINQLESSDIESLRLGRCKHFFLSHFHFSFQEKMLLAVTQNKNIRKILQFLISNKNTGFQKDIVFFTGISKVMVSYYVKQLEHLGIIKRQHHQIQITKDYIFDIN